MELIADHDIVTGIICREHGPFAVGAGNHLAGEGCPRCEGTAIDLRLMADGVENAISSETLMLLQLDAA